MSTELVVGVAFALRSCGLALKTIQALVITKLRLYSQIWDQKLERLTLDNVFND